MATGKIGFGKGYGNKVKKTWNKWKLAEGDNVYRILPPLGNLADDEIWHIYYRTHYGYLGIDPRNPTETQQRTFRCIEQMNHKTKMITQECPACEKYRVEEARVAAAEADLAKTLRSEGKPEQEIEEIMATALQPDKNWLSRHNVDAKQFMNAMLPDGSAFGHLVMSHRTWKQLDEEFSTLKNENGIDALDVDSGVLVNIKRTGKKIASVDKVTIVTEPRPGGVFAIKLRPLTDEEADRALIECPNLSTAGGATLSYEQIEAVVAADGDPDAIEAIFTAASVGRSTARREASPKRAPAPPAAPATQEQKFVEQPKQAEEPAQKPQEAPKAVDPAIATRLAAIKARQEAEAAAKKAAEAAVAQAAVQEAPVDIENMSEEEFIKRFG